MYVHIYKNVRTCVAMMMVNVVAAVVVIVAGVAG